MRLGVGEVPVVIRRLMAFIVQRRWVIAALISVSVITFELFEHPITRGENPLILVFEVVVFGLIFPALFLIVLSLYQSKRAYSQMQSQMRSQRVIEEQLGRARDWDELVNLILQAPRTILPNLGAVLFLHNQQQDTYEAAAHWSFESVALPAPAVQPFSPTCQQCAEQSKSAGVAICRCYPNKALGELPVYCLPLRHPTGQIGVLHLFMPARTPPTPEQSAALNQVAPVLTLALASFRLRENANQNGQSAIAERHRIARYLHDTLAPDLAYLRLKLDQIASEVEFAGSAAAQTDFRRINEVANNTYDYVRLILTELRSEQQADFLRNIEETVRTAQERFHLPVELLQSGEPKPVPAHLASRILIILRECLRNIDQHAQATQAQVSITWLNDRLELQIQDNGIGLGQATFIERPTHFGLKIIQETSAELNGGVEIITAPGQGTCLKVWAPLVGGKSLR